jgi:hypothetical protein
MHNVHKHFCLLLFVIKGWNVLVFNYSFASPSKSKIIEIDKYIYIYSSVYIPALRPWDIYICLQIVFIDVGLKES